MKIPLNIVVEEVRRFNDDLKKTINEKGLTNTGRTGASIQVRTTGNIVESIGVGYIGVLDKGRRPGKFPPVLAIQEWARTKLGISDEKDLKNAAYAISRKIAREGTAIYNDNSKGIELDKKIETLKQSITKNISKYVANVIKNELTKSFKQ